MVRHASPRRHRPPQAPVHDFQMKSLTLLAQEVLLSSPDFEASPRFIPGEPSHKAWLPPARLCVRLAAQSRRRNAVRTVHTELAQSHSAAPWADVTLKAPLRGVAFEAAVLKSAGMQQRPKPREVEATHFFLPESTYVARR